MATTTVTPSAATTRSAAIWPFSQVRLGEQTLTPWLNVVPSDSIATARINQGSFTYPLGTITVDNTSADWLDVEQGMMVWIGTTAGAHDVMVTAARLDTGANTLHIIGTAGDPGVAIRDQIALADDQYVTILYFKPLEVFLSAIRAGVFYRFFDQTYTDEGDDPVPKGQLGKWRQVKIEDNTQATLLFPDPEAEADYAQAGKTIDGAGYTWSVHDVTAAASSAIIEGGGATDETAIIQFDPGFYIVKKEITDSGAKTHTPETYVWVNDDTVYPALDNWEIKGDNQNRVGRKLTIVLHGDEPEADVFPGAAFLLYEKQRGNGEVLSPGLVVDTYVGYADIETPTQEITHGFTEIKLEGPAQILAKIAMATQYIEEVAAPSDWTEVDSNLSNPDGIVWYLIQHHCPQFLQLFDYAPLGDTTLRKKTFTFGGRKLWNQLLEIAELFLGNIGCASDGTLLLRADPSKMSTSDRNALGEVFHWLTDDILEKFVYTQVYRQKVGQVTGYAFSYAGGAVTPLKALWAGAHQGQGASRPVLNGLLTTSSSGQDRLNELVGHYAAQQNSSNPRLSWDALRNLDIADSARMRWHTLNIPATLDPRGRGFDTLRCVPLSVSRKWSKVDQTWLKEVTLTAQPETFGLDAITQIIPVDNGEASTTTIVIPPGTGISFENPGVQNIDGITKGMETVALPNSDGNMYATPSFDFTAIAKGPVWSRYAMGMVGTPQSMTVDAYSPLYLGTGSEVNCWIATSERIYHIADVFGTPNVTSQYTFPEEVHFPANQPQVVIDASFGVQNWVMAAAYYGNTEAQKGCYAYYTTDGVNWTEVQVTGHFQNAGLLNGVPGLYISSKTPGLAYCGAFTSTGATPNSAIYESLDYGATWALSTAFTPGSNGFAFLGLHIPWAVGNEITGYYANYTTPTGITAFDLYKAIGTDGGADLGVSSGGEDYAPWSNSRRWAVRTDVNNPNRAVMVGTSQAKTGVFTTLNDWATYIQVVPSVNNFGGLALAGCAIAGDDGNTVYLWGFDGQVSWSGNFCTTIDDRRGNIPTDFPAAARFIGLMGG